MFFKQKNRFVFYRVLPVVVKLTYFGPIIVGCWWEIPDNYAKKTQKLSLQNHIVESLNSCFYLHARSSSLFLLHPRRHQVIERESKKKSSDVIVSVFVLIKNFKPVYSVFSSGNGSGKVSSITPSTVTKENTSLITGDYLIN